MRSNGSNATLRFWQALLLVGVFVAWHVLTVPEILPAFYFGDPNRAAFLLQLVEQSEPPGENG